MYMLILNAFIQKLILKFDLSNQGSHITSHMSLRPYVKSIIVQVSIMVQPILIHKGSLMHRYGLQYYL